MPQIVHEPAFGQDPAGQEAQSTKWKVFTVLLLKAVVRVEAGFLIKADASQERATSGHEELAPCECEGGKKPISPSMLKAPILFTGLCAAWRPRCSWPLRWLAA
jgi:hypothetical protein